MSIKTDIKTPYQTLNYMKYVEIENDSLFPPVTGGAGQGVFNKSAILVKNIESGQTNAAPFGTGGAVDAFGRLRVSEPFTLLDAKMLNNKLPNIYDEVINGSATSTFIPDDSLVLMSTSADGDYVIRQTPIHFNYQPGKSMLSYFTGVFEPETNIIKRVGMFQGLSAAPYTPSDGIFLESTENYVSFNVIKTQGTPFSLSASQSEWNIDKLDGNGASGLTIDFTKAQLVIIDYEWLSVGRVRCGFMMGGSPIYVHQFANINNLTGPYMTSGSQPVRYEIRQVGSGAGSMKHICSSVMVEGGQENVGFTVTAATSATVAVDTTFRPLLAIRLNPDSHDRSLLVKSLKFLNSGNGDVYWKSVLNPTIIGGSLNWIQADNSADVQVAFGSASLTLSGGYDLTSNFAPAGNAAVQLGAGDGIFTSELGRVGTKINGTPETIVVAGVVRGTGAGAVITAADILVKG